MNEFFKTYQIIDPEPALHWDDGDIGSHYYWPDVLAHMEWHRRMTDWYLRNVAGKSHSDE